MTTRELAKELGAVETIYPVEPAPIYQPFSFLLVLDFEATCWSNEDPKKSKSEIIEFPVVLYDIKNDQIVDEFQQYVMPTENPRLSAFCTALTGIQQHQVDNGIPLPACLLLFAKWLNEKTNLYNMSLPGDKNGMKTCAFATWSDWDLGTCFKTECNRKNIVYHKIFRKWIDVRALFKMNVKKTFAGLCGALGAVGLEFEGNEHCGLHDARNTARLIGKMVELGVVMQLTRK